MKKVLLALVIAAFGASVAHSQAMTSEQQQLDKQVTITLVEMQIKAAASTCFAESQMLVLGYQAKQQGIAIPQLAASTGVKPEDDYYRLFDLGQSLDGPLDKRIKEYFDVCIEKVAVEK